jgi:pimeloyl-ACP methyl ester carboxylesterase
MSYVDSDGVRIYHEVEGHGPPLVLAHGATGDTTFWRGYGYTDQLSNDFTVILFDARGHGRSGKPHAAEAYDYRLMVGDVIAILDTLGINKSHYWGYSMGGYTGLGLAKHHPERLLSLIVGGADPLQISEREREPPLLLAIFQMGLEGGIDAVIEEMKALFGFITPQYERRLRQLDLMALVAVLEAARHRPSFGGALSKFAMPCLLYAGEDDEGPFENGPNAAQRIPNARFFSLPGMNHVGASAAVELVLPEVRSFLSRVGGSAIKPQGNQ